MGTFKVGDKVVSTREDTPHIWIKKGTTYTVSKVRHSGSIELAEIHRDHSYIQSYFELAKANEFKVGDTVRCIDSYGCNITRGEVYTVKEVGGEFLRVITNGRLGGYSYTRFELVRDHVLTPEEVFKHLRVGTKLESRQKGTNTWSGVTNAWCVQLREICNYEWRIFVPVPEIIEANGRKYKLIEE